MSNGRLLIVRGLPGSGKSTYVQNNYPGIFTLETDMFNMSNGQYRWTETRSKECIRLIREFLTDCMYSPNKPDICLTGVFGRLRSFHDYLLIATACNYNVYIVTLTSQYGNIHNVPKETINMFEKNFLPHDELMKFIKEDVYLCESVTDSKMPSLKWTFDPELDKESTNNDYDGEG